MADKELQIDLISFSAKRSQVSELQKASAKKIIMQRIISLIEQIDQKLTMIIDILNLPDDDVQTCVWLDNSDVWRILKVSESTLRRRRVEGKIPFTRIGGKIYYKESDIRALFEKGRN